ncbi:hypothetical protein QTJ16_002447 [Diplocarpon rosae]|uniref:RING-type domain-containing protein n=1 Tax=Diplocarpon rosae TaxID=946125 RepID=A0AAD9T1S8_9HELO|nr:hypothetical protein QTJ16_002447 [Diplocarpon rosae]
MEFTLRCNVLKCRKDVNGHAFVTTCSHIFCMDCSQRSGLATVREGQRIICPACDVQLTNPDDAVVANLNPTEDYKSSVLSGLSPNIIMECASRALNFWTYQTTQEMLVSIEYCPGAFADLASVYHEYVAKNLTDKYNTLSTQVDKIVHDANSEVSSLRNKISELQINDENLRRKNEEVMQALREKTRKHMQTQELYDKLKRRAMLGQVQDAASDAVDHTINNSVAANRFADKFGSQKIRPPPPLFSDQRNNGMQRSSAMGTAGSNAAPQLHPNGSRNAGWAGFGSQASSNRK